VPAAAYKRRMAPTSIVTVARTLGAGGERVAEAVAERLGFRFVDEEIIAIAGERRLAAGVRHRSGRGAQRFSAA